MRPRPRIDWPCAAAWIGLGIFVVTVWMLALIGAGALLGWLA